ncbi:expressed unknown protein [Seminavis robusta]|uniref:Uncharacterized protein n=1 Tax=Seminavis robusta TaxID=568900 RepID=A0A9N8HJU1_9STRA|nr:expressed unknown protein [Seminavis robusta]|eukprot:Sro686_g187060.1 n/a (508) ;mRNA; r:16218-17741
MPMEDREKQCMFCSLLCIVVCAVAIPLAVHFGTSDGSPVLWEPIGSSGLWRNDSGTLEGNVALSASGDRLLVVNLGITVFTDNTTVTTEGRVGVFELQRNDEGHPQEYVSQDGRSSTDGTISYIPGPLVNVSGVYPRQVASMSSDGTTIAIGYPNSRYDDNSNSNNGNLTSGYVSVYRYDDNSTTTENNSTATTGAWVPLGNVPTFDAIMTNTEEIYTGGTLGSATALSGDGTRLAIGITQVQGFASRNDSTSFGYASFVQVMELSSSSNKKWYPLGKMIQGVCNGNTGCIPCQNSFGPGEHDFGMTLSFNAAGTRLAVGTPQAPPCNSNPTDGGFGRVFQYNGIDEEWNQVGPDLVLPTVNNGDTETPEPRELGGSISLASSADHRLAIGSNAGAVVLEYSSDSNSWNIMENRVFIWNNKATFENRYTGVSLTADGNQVAVSGPYATDNGGKAEVWEWYQSNSWKQVGRTLADNRGFGISLEVAETDGKILALKGGFDTKIYQAPR